MCFLNSASFYCAELRYNLIANRKAIKFLRNCFESKNICSEEKNQTTGFACYTKFCDWSIILSVTNQNNTVTGAQAFYLSVST